MKKYYIKPEMVCMDIDTDESILESSNPEPWITDSFDAKQDNDNDFAFDDSSEDEYEDDGASWSRPPFLRPRFH